MAWTVKNDNHESAVIAHFVHNGVPVIIHSGGRYPSLVNDEGVSTSSHPVVKAVVYHDHVQIIASSGVIWHGWTPNATIANLPLVEVHDLVAAVQPYLEEAVARAATVLGEWQDAYKRIWAVPEANLSREAYVAACAEHGAPVRDDAEISESYGIQYGNYAYPHNTVETCIDMKLAFRRWVQIKNDRQAAEDARHIATTATIQDRMARLRPLPVSSTETRRVPAASTPGIGQEHLDRQGRLLTVTASVYRGTISDDDPSIYGEHLLGCEGQKSFDVTYEIRQEIAECPAL